MATKTVDAWNILEETRAFTSGANAIKSLRVIGTTSTALASQSVRRSLLFLRRRGS